MQDITKISYPGLVVRIREISEQKIKQTILWIRQHQKFFEASFRGELKDWAESKLSPEQRKKLRTFSKSLLAKLNNPITRDIRKSEKYFPDVTACFVDCVVGVEAQEVIEPVSAIFDDRKISITRNKNIRVKRGDNLFYKFLSENKHVAGSLIDGIADIKASIVPQWYKDHGLEAHANYELQSIDVDIYPPVEAEVIQGFEEDDVDYKSVENSWVAPQLIPILANSMETLLAQHQHSNVLQEQGGRKRAREEDDKKENAERPSKCLKTHEELPPEPVSEKPACY